MPEIVPMPKLGFDMAEGKLIRKVVQEGQPIKKGDILAEVETDKATVDVEAYTAGVVRAWLVEEGALVPIGTNMVVIAAPDEKVDIEALTGKKPGASSPAPVATPETAPATAPATAPTPVTPAPAAAVVNSGPLRLSPIARRMADEMGIDPRLVTGTGPEGRITKKDIEAYAAAPKAAPATAVSASAVPFAAPSVPVSREDTVVPLTKLRSAIARRMTESKSTVPHFYITNEIDMEAVLTLRQQLNDMLGDTPNTGTATSGVKLSVNDFILKAAALALREFPNLNASFNGKEIVRHGHINMGVAVSVEGGLLTVVVKDADTKSLAQIAAEAKAAAGRAREGKIKPEDMEATTLTVSNLGMYDVESFVAIINPPEAAIIAVGSAKQVPVVKNGALAVGWRMNATISADHRVTDGAEAARFMQVFRKKLEEPLRLLL